MSKVDLKGKTVVITGASGGIGAAAAVAFGRRGSKLVLSGRNLDLLNQAAETTLAFGAEAYVVPGDVTRPEEMRALMDRAWGLTGRLNVAVLGAGFGVLGEAANIPLELWHQQFEVNFFGVLNGFYAALPYFKKQGYGQFIIINSLSGRIAMPLNSAYCASKFALWGFADSARLELKEHNIDLICIYPNFVKTKFQAKILSPDYNVPPDLAWKMGGDAPEKIAEKIARACEKRKEEVLCTVSGNLGARLLPMSHLLSKSFQKISLVITKKLLKAREK